MGEQRLRVLRQSLKRCCTRSSWLAGTDIVLIGCPPSTVEWTADDTNSISKIHAALPKGHNWSSRFETPGGASESRAIPRAASRLRAPTLRKVLFCSLLFYLVKFRFIYARFTAHLVQV